MTPEERAKMIMKGCGEIMVNTENTCCGIQEYDEDFPEVKYDIEYFPECQRAKAQMLEDYKDELESFELHHSKYCGCDRCPSCNIHANNRIQSLQKAIEMLEEEKA